MTAENKKTDQLQVLQRYKLRGKCATAMYMQMTQIKDQRIQVEKGLRCKVLVRVWM